jgi:hypothetical protein
MFINNGAVIEPDLSLGCQGITSGASIHFTFAKRSRGRRMPIARLGLQTRHIERLRLADLAFAPFEMARPHNFELLVRAYRASVPEDHGGEVMATVLQEHGGISEDPLPSAWCDVEDKNKDHATK